MYTDCTKLVTCWIVALYDEPAGFCDVSLVLTICIKSVNVTPVAKVLSVRNAILFFYINS
jgi:hypothetical protein